MRRFALVLALLAACGTETPAPRVCSTSAAVVDGRLATADEEFATVSVAGVCTGVLVAPHVVLTAAHCHEGAGWVSHQGRVASVWDRLQHPDWTKGNTTNDIEVLILADPLPGPYVPIGTPRVGSATVTGYGQDENGKSGTLRIGTGYIDGVYASMLTTSPGTDSCYGDSGGPLYQDGAVVGLTSRGRNAGCGGGSKSVTPDTHKAWLELVSPDPITFIDSGC